MFVYPSSRFKKSYKKLPKYIKEKAKEKDKIFQSNPFSSALDTHKLKGKFKNYWAYSVDDKFRVLFRFEGKNTVLYFDIDDHDIYR